MFVSILTIQLCCAYCGLCAQVVFSVRKLQTSGVSRTPLTFSTVMSSVSVITYTRVISHVVTTSPMCTWTRQAVIYCWIGKEFYPLKIVSNKRFYKRIFITLHFNFVCTLKPVKSFPIYVILAFAKESLMVLSLLSVSLNRIIFAVPLFLWPHCLFI